MKPNELDIKAIHPLKGAKFSPNLFKFLASRRQKVLARYARVYRDREGVLWLGYLDDYFLIGARLMQVLCNGSKAETFAFANLGPLSEVDGFWALYQEHGRCAIDPDHQMFFIGDDTRWSISGERRSCLWCGNAHQSRERWVEKVPRSRWVPAAVPARAGSSA